MPFNRELRVGSAPPYHHNANSGKGNLVFEIRGLTYLELNSFWRSLSKQVNQLLARTHHHYNHEVLCSHLLKQKSSVSSYFKQKGNKFILFSLFYLSFFLEKIRYSVVISSDVNNYLWCWIQILHKLYFWVTRGIDMKLLDIQNVNSRAKVSELTFERKLFK